MTTNAEMGVDQSSHMAAAIALKLRATISPRGPPPS